MRKLLAILTIVLLGASAGIAQQPQIRQISNGSPVYSSTHSQINLRIETGKVWVNGNLIPTKDLPKSLHRIDERIFYQSVVFGIGEIAFSLQGRDYLVKDGRVIEMPRRPEVESNAAEASNTDQKAMEEYYSTMKKEAPALFYSLAREAALTEQCRQLVYRYQSATGKEKRKIRQEIRSILDQLYDINEHNQQLEIEQLQQMIDAAQKEVQIRKANKDLIIENTLEDLLGN